MSVTIKLRKGVASEWTTNSSIVLASGEPGLEIDTGRLKIGDGTTQWGSLQYTSIVPSGFIPGSGINIDLGSNGSTATISVDGLNSSYISDFDEAVDDRIGSGLFVAGTGINLNYNDGGNSFTVSVSGHPHISSDITDFNSSVSGLLPSKYPEVVQLGNVSGTINTNAASGDIFDLNIMSSGTLANPTNPTDGQSIRWRITHKANTIPIVLGSGFNIPSSATTPLPFSSTSGTMDMLGATYDLDRNKWDIIAFVPGY